MIINFPNYHLVGYPQEPLTSIHVTPFFRMNCLEYPKDASQDRHNPNFNATYKTEKRDSSVRKGKQWQQSSRFETFKVYFCFKNTRA